MSLQPVLSADSNRNLRRAWHRGGHGIRQHHSTFQSLGHVRIVWRGIVGDGGSAGYRQCGSSRIAIRAAATKSTTRQNGGHQRVLVTN